MIFFPFKKIPLDSGRGKKVHSVFKKKKKTTVGLEGLGAVSLTATVLTSHLPPLPLKILDTFLTLSSENGNWELPLCSNPVLLGL